MRYLDVCSGISAPTAAWKPLGWQCAAYSEIEPFPCSVLRHHYPDTPNLGDITKYADWPDRGTIDLLVGGTPCQGFSVAGRRGGMDDPRSQLAYSFAGIAAGYRPEWLLWENVPGVISSADGADFKLFLASLQRIGYHVSWRIIDAQYFGVPQRRRRVFVVGHIGDWRRAAAVLFDRESLRGNPAKSRKARQEVAPTISARTRGGGGLGTDFDCDGGLIARCVTSSNQRNDAESETFISYAPIAFDARQDCVSSFRAAGQDGFTPSGICPPIAATDGGGSGVPTIAFSGRERGDDGRGYSRPPQAMEEAVGALDTVKPWNVAGPFGVRRLTPRECERLQGFHDDFTLVPYRGKPACDGPRYKALGNSMAVPVLSWLGRRIEMVSKL